VADALSTSVKHSSRSRAVDLLAAAHFGPTVAVTLVVSLLASGSGLSLLTGAMVTAAVFTGQLTIGWGNDLLDRDRDRASGRSDKPLATGELPVRLVRASLCLAAAACVLLSFSVGWRSAVVHLFLGVASGHAYNLWLKSTVMSWLPYAVAFGTLPAVVTLAGFSPYWPAWWLTSAAAALGVAAHFLNTLPDFEEDAATGVQGLPHRMGRGASRVLATVLLLAASAVAVLGAGTPPAWSWSALAGTAALAGVVLLGRGKSPFYAAIVIAVLDVATLAFLS
jgi:4-hydroxybenzoate polyprenyltransferase